MAITGWDFFSNLQDNIDSVSVDDIVSAGKEYLDLPSYIATVTYPETGEEEIDIAPGPTSDEVVAYYEGRQFPEYDLSSGKDFKMPKVGSVSSKGLKHSTYLKEILGNGMTVVVKSNPYSRVFALNVIGKNRSASEQRGLEGITDFVNRMIEKGTTSRSAEKLFQDLASIGANVTLYDNPWIPFDDRYTTRQYSFMKFETIDQFTEKGIELFSDMIFNPAFDSSEVEEVRSAIFGLLARNSGSTYKTARNKFYETLFAGTAYAGSIEGNFRTIKSITASDLKEHHSKMYSPENIIVTIGTNWKPDRIMAMLKEQLGGIPSAGISATEPINPKKLKGVQTAHAKMEKGQVYIYLGNLLPSAVSPEAPVLKVANAVLSARVRQQLREKQGLAYSVGSSVTLDKDFGWYLCSMGTGIENYETARNGIIEEIERLKTDAPSSAELEDAVNSIWGSYLMANLSRINQAFYMGVDEYLGLGYNYGDFFIDQIGSVTPEQVVEAAKKYFDTENYVIATAGNI